MHFPAFLAEQFTKFTNSVTLYGRNKSGDGRSKRSREMTKKRTVWLPIADLVNDNWRACRQFVLSRERSSLFINFPHNIWDSATSCFLLHAHSLASHMHTVFSSVPNVATCGHSLFFDLPKSGNTRQEY